MHNRILKRLAYIELDNLQISNLDQFEIEDFIKSNLTDTIKKDLKELTIYRDKEDFKNKVITTCNNLNLLKMKVEKLQKIIDKALRQY